jgi:hypothetical protein
MVKPQSQTENDRPVIGPARRRVRRAPAWADGLVGLPIGALARGDVGPLLSGRAWLDSAFDAVAALLTVQRQSVDRLLQAQHRIVAEIVDAGWARMTAHQWRRPVPDRAKDARR